MSKSFSSMPMVEVPTQVTLKLCTGLIGARPAKTPAAHHTRGEMRKAKYKLADPFFVQGVRFLVEGSCRCGLKFFA